MTTETPCPLCTPKLAGLLVALPDCQIIDAQDADYPGFTRIVWHQHVREMSDLSADEQARLMARVLMVEQVMRNTLSPDKINLACLGNQVPHIHWHVIPRWRDDRAFPGSVWTPQPDSRAAIARRQIVRSRLADYHQALVQRLSSLTT